MLGGHNVALGFMFISAPLLQGGITLVLLVSAGLLQEQ